jgi:hypothetical protein
MWLYSYMRQPLMLFYVRLAMIVHNWGIVIGVKKMEVCVLHVFDI